MLFATADCRVLEKTDRFSVPTSNIENWARDLRYRLIAEMIEEGDEVLFAHHADDQIETFLIRMFRGSSIKGMSSMNNITMMNNVILLSQQNA